MKLLNLILPFFLFLFPSYFLAQDESKVTLDRMFNSSDFRQEYLGPIQWIENGEAYIKKEPSKLLEKEKDLVRYSSNSEKKEIWISAPSLIPKGQSSPINVEQFSLTPDQKKVILFTNSKRVWRSNTKGDFWVFDLKTKELRRLGASFPSSSLMFAKFSPDNSYVAYIHEFNLYKENLDSGEVTQLTFDGSRDIINGTFDWVYEEEFGCRDGFRWSPDGAHIALWQLDASAIGTFMMINNTDSIYPETIPVQYPKVGQDPSACKVGVIHTASKKLHWIEMEGDSKQHYIPRMQWINPQTLLIQRINRKQNHLKIWSYNVEKKDLQLVYSEQEKTWVDISYPDITANGWGMNDLTIIENGSSFLRLSETDGWRHVYKINLKDGKKICLTPGEYDVASIYGHDDKNLFFSASPETSTQRYLYMTDLDGKGTATRVTPKTFPGINKYNFSPNGKYAIHNHSNATTPSTQTLIKASNHKSISSLVKNEKYKNTIAKIDMPSVEFFTVTTEEGIEVDGRMLKPKNFDPTKKYPVLFNVYGEPWGAVAIDSWGSMFNTLLTQQGYIVIAMDNRGTPCLKGSEWRKSIYRKIGIINARDQALAAKEILKRPYLDDERVAVWGWSGGGSMTLNLLFQYPEIYHTGMSVAPVANQLLYDNAYQERYMGLPSENMEDFINGSPISHAKNLKGNLLLIHGTGDDNVHYQNAEVLINELIKHNKIFSMMAYPNRSHGIYEGKGTSLHLYSTLLNYLNTHCPVENTGSTKP